MRVQLAFLLESNDQNTVFWIERRGGARLRRGKQNVFLQATPIDVSRDPAAPLFDNLDTAC